MPVEPTTKQKVAAQVARLSAEQGMTPAQARKYGAGNPGKAQELYPGAQNPDMPQAQYLVNKDMGSIERLDPNPSETIPNAILGPGGAESLAGLKGAPAEITRQLLGLVDPASQLAILGGGAAAMAPKASLLNKAGRVGAGVFAANTGKQTYDKAMDGDPGGAGVTGILAILAGAHAAGVKVPKVFKKAEADTAVTEQRLQPGATQSLPPGGQKPLMPTTLNSQIIPGLDKFVVEDITGKAVPAVKGAYNALKASLSPSTVSIEAADTAGSFRQAGAEFARKQALAEEALKSAKKYTMTMDPAQQLAVTHSIETGAPITDPKVGEFVKVMRDQYDSRVAKIQAMGGLQHLIDDYMPHIWKDPNKATNYYAGAGSRRPLEGSKSFMKQRTIPTTADGIAAGLEPVTTDPVELTMLKLREMDRYILGQDVFREMKANGNAKFYRPGDVPDGWVKLDDKIAKVTQAVPTTNAAGNPGAPLFVDRGAYYAPESAARVFNNYLSPGLRGNGAYDLAAFANNSLNQAQLGLSAFHLMFTAVDSTVGKLALAGEYLSQGKVGKAFLNTAKAATPLYSPIENIIKGNRIAKAYRNPALATGEMAQMIDALQAGGGRVHMDSFYKNSSVESFWKALKTGNYPGAALRAFPAAIEMAAKPLMEYTVPRMKLGAFSDLARMEMERLPAGASAAERRAVMGKAWDSVDNRLGQMVYDNLFWNKTLKDLGMISTRSLGWNLGTIRELGGAIGDTATSVGRIKSRGPLITHKMAYAAALPATMALYGAMYQYMMTGKGPEELKDYFQPQTNEEGDRVQFPSYLKDVEHYYTKPGVTLSHKMGPLWSGLRDMMFNEDFYGNEIKNPTDPLVMQAGQEAAFIGNQFLPFAMKGNPNKKDEETTAEKVRRFIGILPASQEYSESQLAKFKAMREFKKAKELQGEGR